MTISSFLFIRAIVHFWFYVYYASITYGNDYMHITQPLVIIIITITITITIVIILRMINIIMVVKMIIIVNSGNNNINNNNNNNLLIRPRWSLVSSKVWVMPLLELCAKIMHIYISAKRLNLLWFEHISEFIQLLFNLNCNSIKSKL